METYGLWVLAGTFVGYFGLTDQGIRPAVCRFKGVALILTADGVANLGLSLLLAQWWGVTGVAAGTLFTRTVTMACFIPLFSTRVFKSSYGVLFRRAHMRVLWIFPVLFCFLMVLKMTWTPAGSIQVVASATLVGFIYFPLVYIVVLRMMQGND